MFTSTQYACSASVTITMLKCTCKLSLMLQKIFKVAAHTYTYYQLTCRLAESTRQLQLASITGHMNTNARSPVLIATTRHQTSDIFQSKVGFV